MEDIGTYEITTNSSVPLMEREDIIPTRMRNAYAQLPEEFKYKDEAELRKYPKITLIDERLRSAFWREVQIALNTKKPIMQSHIYHGVCTETHFCRIVATPERLAWITQPIIAYETRTEGLLTLAVGRYEEILSMDIMTKKKVLSGMDDDGKNEYEIKDVVDPFRAKLLMDTINKLEDRVKGLSVQRNVTIHERQDSNEPKDLSMENINEKIKLLSEQAGIAIEGEVLDDNNEQEVGRGNRRLNTEEAIITSSTVID